MLTAVIYALLTFTLAIPLGGARLLAHSGGHSGDPSRDHSRDERRTDVRSDRLLKPPTLANATRIDGIDSTDSILSTDSIHRSNEPLTPATANSESAPRSLPPATSAAEQDPSVTLVA